jgi:hypothetical protein
MRIKGTYLIDIMTIILGIILVILTVESYLWDKDWSIQRNYLNIIFLLILVFMKYSIHKNHDYIPHGIFMFVIAHFILGFERELQFEKVP